MATWRPTKQTARMSDGGSETESINGGFERRRFGRRCKQLKPCARFAFEAFCPIRWHILGRADTQAMPGTATSASVFLGLLAEHRAERRSRASCPRPVSSSRSLAPVPGIGVVYNPGPRVVSMPARAGRAEGGRRPPGPRKELRELRGDFRKTALARAAVLVAGVRCELGGRVGSAYD